MTRFSNEGCINAYGQGNSHMQGYGNLLVVTKDQHEKSNATVLLEFQYKDYISNYTGNNWVCGPEYLLSHNNKCNFKDLVSNSSA
jgi:hypothetical protein